MVKRLLWITGFCAAARSYVKKSDSSNWSFIQMHLNLQFDMENTLNKVTIAAKASEDSAISKKERLFARLRMYLRTPPTQRSNKEVNEIYRFLRSHPAMQEFPVEIQLSICRNAFWQQYKSRQVIYKEGSPMGCFYIMMDGIVLLNVMHENENYDPDSPVAMNRRKNFPVTIDELSGGYSFGGDTEDHVRKHTVSYSSIINEPFHQKRKEDITLIQKLPLFMNYPVQDLYSCDPTVLFSSYYTAGSIVVSNILTSDSFIIVKSGRCRVLMKLGQVDARKARKMPSLDMSVDEVSSINLKEIFPLYYEDVSRINRYKLSSPYMRGRTNDLRASVFSRLNERPSRMLALANKTADATAQTDRRRRSSSVTLPPNLMRKYGSLFASQASSSTSVKAIKDRFVRTEYSPPSPASEKAGASTYEQPVKASSEPDNASLGVSATRHRSSKKTRHSMLTLIEEPEGEKEKKSPDFQDSLPTVSHSGKSRTDLSTGKSTATYLRTPRTSQSLERNRGVAQIAVLERGAVFGIESLVDAVSMQLSLVSDGCECIHFSKRYFLRTASTQVMHDLADMLIAFPSPEYCASQIERAHQWQKYKKTVLSDLKSQRTARKHPLSLRLDL